MLGHSIVTRSLVTLTVAGSAMVGLGVLAVGRPLQPPFFAVWRNDPRPIYHSPAPHGGPSYPDSVDLSCGALEHEPDEDVTAYDRFTGDIGFSRIYTTPLALAGMSDPGMAVGWRSSFSISARPKDEKAWSELRFEDPKGAVEAWAPSMIDGKPTGKFPVHPGSPFLVEGVPSSTVGHWEAITWRMNGLAKWVFLPGSGPNANVYRLTQMFASNGMATNLKYDSANGYRLSELDDNEGKMLMAFDYNSTGLMSKVTTKTGIYVNFSYSSQAGANCLTVASPRSTPEDDQSKNVFWKYGYDLIRGRPFLSTVETPVPGHPTLSLHRNVYDKETGKEAVFLDANGNRTVFNYREGKTDVTTTPAGRLTMLDKPSGRG